MYMLKCVLVGDDSIGKSTLLARLANDPNIPIKCTDGWGMNHTCLDSMLVEEPYPDPVNPSRIVLYDTIGNEGSGRLRPLSYPDSHSFLICFSIADRASFYNVEQKWLPELTHFSCLTRYILVGLKGDLRCDDALDDDSDDDEITLEKGKFSVKFRQASELVTEREARALAKKIHAEGYFEVASPTCEAACELRRKIIDLAPLRQKIVHERHKGTGRRKSNGPPRWLIPPMLAGLFIMAPAILIGQLLVESGKHIRDRLKQDKKPGYR